MTPVCSMILPSGVTNRVIAVQLVADASFRREALHLLDRVTRIHSDETHLIAELGVRFGEVGKFLGARRAVGEPKVDHQRLTDERSRIDVVAVAIAERNERQWIALEILVGEAVVRELDDLTTVGQRCVEWVIASVGDDHNESNNDQCSHCKRTGKQSWSGDLHSLEGSDVVGAAARSPAKRFITE
jgi:hypothetical protein